MRAKGKVKVVKSGSAPSKPVKYLYYEQMQFLDKVQKGNTTSNFQSQDAEDNVSGDECDVTVITNEDEVNDDISDTQNVEESGTRRIIKIKEKKKEKLDNFGENILTLLRSSKETEDDADRSFLLSLLPHVKSFDEDKKLIFQTEVLQLIMRIKRGTGAPIYPIPPSTGNIRFSPYPQNPYYRTIASTSQINYMHPHQHSSMSDPYYHSSSASVQGPLQNNSYDSFEQSQSWALTN